MKDQTLDALSACIRLSRKLLEKSAVDETMTSTEIVSVGALARPWKVGAHFVGEICQYEGITYRCCQSHDSTGNETWTPDNVPALWAQYHTTDYKRALPYAQPTGAQDAYQFDECVVFDGKIYRCLVNATVHDPSVLPASWKQIEEEDT